VCLRRDVVERRLGRTPPFEAPFCGVEQEVARVVGSFGQCVAPTMLSSLDHRETSRDTGNCFRFTLHDGGLVGPISMTSGQVYAQHVRRGTVVEVVELGELTLSTLPDPPEQPPAVMADGEEHEEVVVVRA
jgi:hypothetical protein